MKKRASNNSVSSTVLSSRHTNLLERARAFPVEAVRPWGNPAKFKNPAYCDVRPCSAATTLVGLAALLCCHWCTCWLWLLRSSSPIPSCILVFGLLYVLRHRMFNQPVPPAQLAKKPK